MSKEQLEALLEWIRAAIDDRLSRSSSDGGLSEAIRLIELEKDLFAIFDPGPKEVD